MNNTGNGNEKNDQHELAVSTKHLASATFVIALVEVLSLIVFGIMLWQNGKLIGQAQGTSGQVNAALELLCKSVTSSPSIQQVMVGSTPLTPTDGRYIISDLRRASAVKIDLTNKGHIAFTPTVELVLKRGIDSAKCPARGAKVQPGGTASLEVDLAGCLQGERIPARGGASFGVIATSTGSCG